MNITRPLTFVLSIVMVTLAHAEDRRLIQGTSPVANAAKVAIPSVDDLRGKSTRRPRQPIGNIVRYGLNVHPGARVLRFAATR